MVRKVFFGGRVFGMWRLLGSVVILVGELFYVVDNEVCVVVRVVCVWVNFFCLEVSVVWVWVVLVGEVVLVFM